MKSKSTWAAAVTFVCSTLQLGASGVTITTPANGSIVQGMVNVAVGTMPDVTSVQFLVDGVVQATVTHPPFEFAWNPALNPLPPANHPIDLGYFEVEWKNEDDFAAARAEVNGYTNTYNASLSNYDSGKTPTQMMAALRASLAAAAAEGKRVNLELDILPDNLDGLWEMELDTAAPFWGSIARLALFDEPSPGFPDRKSTRLNSSH